MFVLQYVHKNDKQRDFKRDIWICIIFFLFATITATQIMMPFDTHPDMFLKQSYST